VVVRSSPVELRSSLIPPVMPMRNIRQHPVKTSSTDSGVHRHRERTGSGSHGERHGDASKTSNLGDRRLRTS
jgi:hypothetical protein